MSEQPPPYPPASYSPYGAPGPPPGPSNKARFWIGVLLAIPYVVVGFVLLAVTTGGREAVGLDPVLDGPIQLVDSLVVLGALVAGIVWERTRWFALGIIAGVAILGVVAAGACVVLLVALTSSYS